MKKSSLPLAVLCAALALASPDIATAAGFSFGVFSRTSDPNFDDSMLRAIIEETDADNLAFVVANGIKANDEPCTDTIYQRRKSLLADAKHGLVVSLAASDWAKCRSENGKSAAIAKLNRVRDLFFDDDFSLGGTRIPVTRQSTAAKFRTVVENARWEIGKVMFATVNLPSKNNHYVYDAGRNSEFEDRLVANREWLNRIFTFASRKKAAGIVLFCDGNPLSAKLPPAERRDGFTEIRKQILAQASRFPGRVLIIHGQANASSDAPRIAWRGNLGELAAGSEWTKVTIDNRSPELFASENRGNHGANANNGHSRKRGGDGVALR